MEEKSKEFSAMGMSGMILGIISIISCLFYYISIPTAIIAIVFGAKSIKKMRSGMGKAGLVTGIIGLCLCLFIYISMVIILMISNYYYY